MGDMVYNALRRKLAAAEATGDLDRIERLRDMMGVPAEAPPVPADVIETVQRARDWWPEPVDQAIDLDNDE